MEKRPMVVRVTNIDFELDDGRVFPHPVELDDIPSIEEFQRLYDKSRKLVGEMLNND